MSKRKHLYSNHHKFPKHLGGSNHRDNIVYMKDIRHRALHILFDEHGKATMPTEQIITHLDLHTSCLIDEFQNDVKTLIAHYGQDIYNSNCIK